MADSLEIKIEKRHLGYFIFTALVLMGISYAVAQSGPNPGHPASQVGPGTFAASGTYTFPSGSQVCIGSGCVSSFSEIPSGFCIFSSTAAGCPSGGWTRDTSFDGKTIRGAATPGGTGGTDSHSHSSGSYAAPSHSHSISVSTKVNTLSCDGMGSSCEPVVTGVSSSTGGSGSLSISGTSGSASSWPPYVDVIVCCKN